MDIKKHGFPSIWKLGFLSASIITTVFIISCLASESTPPFLVESYMLWTVFLGSTFSCASFCLSYAFLLNIHLQENKRKARQINVDELQGLIFFFKKKGT